MSNEEKDSQETERSPEGRGPKVSMSSPPPADPPSGPDLQFCDDDGDESERLRESFAAMLRRLFSDDVPARFGAYELERSVGSGGFGRVWRARHSRTGARAVVKFMPATSPGAEEAADAEVRALAAVRHPHIVEVLDRGCESGFHWIALQCVDGETLKVRIDRRRAGGGAVAPPDEVARIMRWTRDAALALHAMHGQGRVHRDLKPANLMIDDAGQIRLIDLGLAIGEDGGLSPAFAGTAAYMSPEQTHPRETLLGPPSDVYSLAVTMHEALTGARVVRESSRDLALHAVATVPVPPPSRVAPDLPRTLDPLFRRALAKNVADRYATAAELAEDVGRWLEGRPPLHATQRIVERARRRIGLVVAALLVAVAAVAVTSAVVASREREAKYAWVRLLSTERRYDEALRALGELRPTYGGRDDFAALSREVLPTAVADLYERIQRSLTSSLIGVRGSVYAKLREAADRWTADLGYRLPQLEELRGLALLFDEEYALAAEAFEFAAKPSFAADSSGRLHPARQLAELARRRALPVAKTGSQAASDDDAALKPMSADVAETLSPMQLRAAMTVRLFLADRDPKRYATLLDDAVASRLESVVASSRAGVGRDELGAALLACRRRLIGDSREAYEAYLRMAADAGPGTPEWVAARGFAAVSAAAAADVADAWRDEATAARLRRSCAEDLRAYLSGLEADVESAFVRLVERLTADLRVLHVLRPEEGSRIDAVAHLLSAGRTVFFDGAGAAPASRPLYATLAAARKGADFAATLRPRDTAAVERVFAAAGGWKLPESASADEAFLYYCGWVAVAGSCARAVGDASPVWLAETHERVAVALNLGMSAIGDRLPTGGFADAVRAIAAEGAANVLRRAGDAAGAAAMVATARQSATRAVENKDGPRWEAVRAALIDRSLSGLVEQYARTPQSWSMATLASLDSPPAPPVDKTPATRPPGR